MDPSELEAALRCEICTASFDAVAALLLPQCGHTFCRACCAQLLRLSPRAAVAKCPTCRAPIHHTLDELPRNYALESVVALLSSLLLSPPVEILSACSPAALAATAGTPGGGDALAAGAQPPSPPPPRSTALPPAVEPAPLDMERLMADLRDARAARRAEAAAAAASAARLAHGAAAAPRASPPAAEVEAAIVALVTTAGRPVPLPAVANHLADRRLWPPAQLAALLQQQQQGVPMTLAALSTPSPAVIKGFLASRGALAPPCSDHDGPAAWPLHLEIGRASLAECVCAGGPLCLRGRDALSKRRQLAAATAAPYVPPSLRDADGGRAGGGGRHVGAAAGAGAGSGSRAAQWDIDVDLDERYAMQFAIDQGDTGVGRLTGGRGKGRRW